MSEKLTPQDVFTPGGFPKYTFVPNLDIEERLQMSPKGFAIVVSGPSKSGKTTLIESFYGKEKLVVISGGSIKSRDQFWKLVFEATKKPSSYQQKTDTAKTNKTGGSTTGKGKFIVTEASATLSHERGTTTTQSVQHSYDSTSSTVVADYLAKENRVLVIDDFHYVESGLRSEIAKDLKAKMQEFQIVFIVIPHRSQDPVVANSDLNGRITRIELKYWNVDDLKKIPENGFKNLGKNISKETINKLADEAIGSPQLMQNLCLQSCIKLSWKAGFDELDDNAFKSVCNSIVDSIALDNVVKVLAKGADPRGSKRLTYRLKKDGFLADNYCLILEALICNPPMISVDYDEIMKRIRSVLDNDVSPPKNNLITGTLSQINKLIEENDENVKMENSTDESRVFYVMEWKDETLHVVDPYFLYMLRWKGYRKAVEEAAKEAAKEALKADNSSDSQKTGTSC